MPHPSFEGKMTTKEYNAWRKECRERKNEYRQWNKERRKAYRKAYSQLPEVKERTREYQQRPEFKAYQKEYRNRLEVKERRKERSMERRKSEILFQVMRLMQSQSEQND